MDGAEDLDWGEEVQVNEDDAISLGAASDDDLEQIQKYKGAADDEGDEGDDGPPPGTPPRRALHPLVPPPPALTVDEPADGHAAAVHGPAGAVATLEPSPKASTGSVSPSQPADDNDNDNGDSAAQADTRNTRSQNRFSVPHPLPERPLAQQDSQDSQEMSVSLTASAMAVPHSRRDSLPHGWNTKTSSTGEVYFINVVTRETQWERPTVPAENRRRTRTELPMESTRNDTQRPNGRESRRDMDSYRPNPDSSGRDSRWRSQQGDIDSSDRVPARGSRGFGANGIANEPRRAPDPNVDSRRGDMQNTRRPRFDSYRPDSDDHRGPLVPRDDLRPSGIAARDNADRRPPRDGPADAGWSRTRGLQGPIDERRTIANDHPRQPRNGPIDDHRGHSQRSPPRQFAEPDRPAPSERYRDRVDTVSQQRQTVPEGGSSRWPADQDVPPGRSIHDPNSSTVRREPQVGSGRAPFRQEARDDLPPPRSTRQIPDDMRNTGAPGPDNGRRQWTNRPMRDDDRPMGRAQDAPMRPMDRDRGQVARDTEPGFSRGQDRREHNGPPMRDPQGPRGVGPRDRPEPMHRAPPNVSSDASREAGEYRSSSLSLEGADRRAPAAPARSGRIHSPPPPEFEAKRRRVVDDPDSTLARNRMEEQGGSSGAEASRKRKPLLPQGAIFSQSFQEPSEPLRRRDGFEQRRLHDAGGPGTSTLTPLSSLDDRDRDRPVRGSAGFDDRGRDRDRPLPGRVEDMQPVRQMTDADRPPQRAAFLQNDDAGRRPFDGSRPRARSTSPRPLQPQRSFRDERQSNREPVGMGRDRDVDHHVPRGERGPRGDGPNGPRDRNPPRGNRDDSFAGDGPQRSFVNPARRGPEHVDAPRNGYAHRQGQGQEPVPMRQWGPRDHDEPRATALPDQSASFRNAGDSDLQQGDNARGRHRPRSSSLRDEVNDMQSSFSSAIGLNGMGPDRPPPSLHIDTSPHVHGPSQRFGRDGLPQQSPGHAMGQLPSAGPLSARRSPLVLRGGLPDQGPAVNGVPLVHRSPRTSTFNAQPPFPPGPQRHSPMMAPSNGLMPTPPVPVSTQAGFYPQHQSPAAHSPHALPMNMSRSPNIGPGRPLLGNRQLSDANPGPHRGDNGWGDRDGGGRSQPFREDGLPVRMRSTSPSLRRGPPPMNDRRSGRDIEVAFHPLGEDVQMSRRPMDLNTVRHSPEQTRLALGLSTMDQPPPRSLHDRIQPAGSAAGPTSRDGPPVSSSDPPRNIDVYMSEPASRRRPPMFDETTEFASTSHARKPSLRERISDTGVSTANDAESNWNQVDVPMDVDASGDVHRGGGRGRFQQRRGNGRGRGYRR